MLAPLAELIIERDGRSARVELRDGFCSLRTTQPELIRAIDLAFAGLQKSPPAIGRAGAITARFVPSGSLTLDPELFFVRAEPSPDVLRQAQAQHSAELRQVDAAIAELADVANLSPELPDKMGRFTESKIKLDRDLAKFRQEREDAEDELHRFQIAPLMKDPYFTGALAAVALCFGASVFFDVTWLAFLNLFGAFVACGVAIGHVNQLEEKHLLTTKVKSLDERDARLKSGFEAEMGEIEKLNADFGPMHVGAAVSRRAELTRHQDRRSMLVSELDEITRDLKRAGEGDGISELIGRAARAFRVTPDALEAARPWPPHIAKLFVLAACPDAVDTPVLIHDFYGALSEPDRSTAVELLNQIGQKRQVIVLTARPDFLGQKPIDLSAV